MLQVLDTLRKLDSEKADEAEQAFDEEKLWLLRAIEQLRKNLATCKKPFRRQEKVSHPWQEVQKSASEWHTLHIQRPAALLALPLIKQPGISS